MPEATSFPQFSPVRMRAATEDAAIDQALLIVGLPRDQVSVEVLEQDARGVTVRVSPRRDGEDANAPQAPAQSTLGASSAVAEESDVDEFVAEHEAADDATEVVPSESAPLIDATPIAHAPARAPRVIDAAAQQRALAAIDEMLERMGMEADASLADGPFSPIEAGDDEAASRLYIKIEGNDVGILIGKHGQTLQSLQYLLNLSLNNRTHEEGSETQDAPREDAVRVVLDAGGYRSRRAQVLQQSAQEAAARAKRDRRSIRLEPMPAHERRLVHMALREDGTISTGSEGREPLRHVVISPAGMRPSGGERPERAGGGGRGGNRGGFGFGGGGNRGGSGYGGGNRGGGYGNRSER